jgi:hypothetical protein
LGDATWCSFGFFPPRTVIPLMIGMLSALILATLVGVVIQLTTQAAGHGLFLNCKPAQFSG